MSVIAKLSCGAIEDFGGTSKRITLHAVYPTDEERETQGENAKFNNATPNMNVTMHVDNPAGLSNSSRASSIIVCSTLPISAWPQH